MNAFLVGVLSFLVGVGFGWVMAHEEIASECERLGGFFVGKKGFRCTAITGAVFDDQKSEKTPGNPP